MSTLLTTFSPPMRNKADIVIGLAQYMVQTEASEVTDSMKTVYISSSVYHYIYISSLLIHTVFIELVR